MLSAREATLDLLRAHGMTTIFGNPGSTDLPMLADFPADFRYVLGLQEAVVVGYAQASGRVAHANLHTAPGVGNAMGALFNARANKAPLLITAGQQVRAYQTLQANLTNHRATEVPQPYVKWSFEPPRAADVPAAIARAIHTASLPPAGPAGDRGAGRSPGRRPAAGARRGAEHRRRRGVGGRGRPSSSRCPCGRRRHRAAGGWASPSPIRCSPECVPPAIGPAGQVMGRYDLVLVAGSSVFPYYPYVPGPALPAGTELVALTDDPDEAARVPVGDAIVGDVALGLAALLEALGGVQRPPVGDGEPAPPAPPVAGAPGRIDPAAAFDALADVLPDDAIVVLESPSTTLVFRDRARLARPGSFYFGASGGLGFGLPPPSASSLPNPTVRSCAS